jgi:hypothetical protein
MSYLNYRVGPGLTTMIALEALGVPAPSKAPPVDYPQYLDLGDGGRRGVGGLATSWRFVYLTAAQWAALRAVCPGASAAVYVQTLAADGSYRLYQAMMLMGAPKTPSADAYLDVVIEFRNMLEVV